jgi:hypothetical protein
LIITGGYAGNKVEEGVAVPQAHPVVFTARAEKILAVPAEALVAFTLKSIFIHRRT